MNDAAVKSGGSGEEAREVSGDERSVKTSSVSLSIVGEAKRKPKKKWLDDQIARKYCDGEWARKR